MKKAWLIALTCLLLGGLVLWSTFSPPAPPTRPVDSDQDVTASTGPDARPEESPVETPTVPQVLANRSAPAVENLGVTQDRQLAEQNDAQAQMALGERYLTGNGVPLDEAKALQWFQRAAKLGDPTAQLKVGQMYESGQGTERNLERASIWFTKAAENGDPAAQANLADLYEFGDGTRSNKAAAYWNEKAASQGYVAAQLDLGRMYQNGTGVPKDNVEAYVWYSLAAASGDANAVRNRDAVAAGLSPEELSAARDRVREWKPKRTGSP